MTWFFEEISVTRRNCFRFLVCAISIAIVFIYIPIAELVFSKDGLRTAREVFQQAPAVTFFIFNDTLSFAYVVMGVCIISLSLLAIGFRPLYTSAIAFLTFISLFNRYPNLDYGGSMVMSVALFLQVLQAVFDRFYPSQNPHQCHGWTIRAMQIQLALIYVFAGIAKLRSDMWLSGEAFARIMNSEQAIFIIPQLGSMPLLSAILSYGTIAAELSFIFLVWRQKTRWIALSSMFLIHLGIFLSLHVTVLFTEGFFVLLTAFFTDDEWKKLTSSFYTAKPDVPSPV